MLRVKKIISIILILILVLSLPLTTFADKPDHARGNDKWSTDKWDEHALKKGHHDDEERIEEINRLIENLEMKLGIIDESDDFEDLHPDLTIGEAEELLEMLKEELKDLYLSQKDLKAELRKLRKEMRTLVRNGYTEEELAYYEDLKDALEDQYEGITVLDVDSIVSKNINLKFEGLPPVIKDGRTLIPVAALVKGFGAHVEWDPDARTVLIWKDDIEILITIGSNIALVNGLEVEIDSNAEIINNRTIVPLRFIAEIFHMKVNWDPDDKTIELDDSDTTLSVTGNGFAIIGAQIMIPLTTTVAELDAAITEADGGTYTIEDTEGNILDPTDAEDMVKVITLTDVVVSLAENGYSEETYHMTYGETDTLLTVEGLGFYVNGGVVTIPEGTVLEALEDAITVPEGATYVITNTSGAAITLDEQVIDATDLIKVTAQNDTTHQSYTLRFALTDTEIDVDVYDLTDMVISIPFETTIGELDAAITAAEKGTYVIKDEEGDVIENDDRLVKVNDIIVSTAEDQVTTSEYTVIILPNDDTTLSIDGLGMSIEGLVITIPAETPRDVLFPALTAAPDGEFFLENGSGGSLDFDATDLLLSDVIISYAEDDTFATYTFAFALTDTELSIEEESEGYSITDLEITVPYGSDRLALDAAIIAAVGGSYRIEDGDNNVLSYDATLVVDSNVVISLAQDENEDNAAEYTIVVTPVSTVTVLTIEGEGFEINDLVITVPYGAIRTDLDTALTEAFGGTYAIEDGANGVLSFDSTLLIDANVIVSLAQDGETEATYTISVTPISTVTTLTLDGLEMTIDHETPTITVPQHTTRLALDTALTAAFCGTYSIEDGSGTAYTDLTLELVEDDVVISYAQDETVFVEYAVTIVLP